MKEAQAMMQDPNFQAQMKKMTQNPQFCHFDLLGEVS
jgi:hypothetical protein